MKNIISESLCRYCPYFVLEKLQDYVYRPCCRYEGPRCDDDMFNLPACECGSDRTFDKVYENLSYNDLCSLIEKKWRIYDSWSECPSIQREIEKEINFINCLLQSR